MIATKWTSNETQSVNQFAIRFWERVHELAGRRVMLLHYLGYVSERIAGHRRPRFVANR